MDLVKVKFLKNGKPYGRAYTYETPVKVEVGNLVQVNENSVAEVTQVGVSIEEIENFRDKLKSIVGIAKEVEVAIPEE